MPRNGSISVMQPYLFPYLGYFQLAHAADHFVFLDDVDFIKKGWINRNRILGNNDAQYFTVPLKKASQNRKINEINVSIEEKWLKKFFNTLYHQYKKAPNFEKVQVVLSKVINTNRDGYLISDLAIESIESVFQYLEIGFSYSRSSELAKSTLKGQEKIISICQANSSVHYINPINGRSLYSKGDFEKENIKLSFIEMNDIRYKQFDHNGFVPFLSIIDCLMFLTEDEIKRYLLNYNLD
jgi:hypothetical protein